MLEHQKSYGEVSKCDLSASQPEMTFDQIKIHVYGLLNKQKSNVYDCSVK